MKQYQAWSMKEMPKYMGEMKSLLGGIFNLPRVVPQSSGRQKSKRRKTKAEQTARQRQLDQLRPLFAPGVNDEQVQDVLDNARPLPKTCLPSSCRFWVSPISTQT